MWFWPLLKKKETYTQMLKLPTGVIWVVGSKNNETETVCFTLYCQNHIERGRIGNALNFTKWKWDISENLALFYSRKFFKLD